MSIIKALAPLPVLRQKRAEPCNEHLAYTKHVSDFALRDRLAAWSVGRVVAYEAC